MVYSVGFPFSVRLPDDVRPADNTETISEDEELVPEDFNILNHVSASLDLQQ